MKIAAVQLYLRDGRTKEEMVDYALRMLERCRGADLIVLPELWNIGFAAYDRFEKESEPLDGYTATAIAEKARELKAYIYSGSFVEQCGERLYNTAVFFDRNGERIAFYRKMHLFTYRSRETEFFSPGTDVCVVDTEYGPMGLSICYDLRFPELYRKMVDMRAKFFLVASAWPFPRLEPWEFFHRARAAENICYLVSSNASGKQAGALYLGHSKIVDPWGTVVADSDFREAIVTAEIDPAYVDEVRTAFPSLKDRVM